MVSGAFSAAYKVLIADWERSTGHKVTTVSGASMGGAPTSIPSRLGRGEPADVVILARTALDALANDGKVVSGSQVDLADSRIGMAVKAGVSKPGISNVDDVRQGPVEQVVSSMAHSGRIRVRTPQADALASALKAAGADVATNEDGALLVTGADAPAVGAAALRAGVELHELVAERPDLEEVFLELTQGKADIR